MPPRLDAPTVRLRDVCFCHWPVDAAAIRRAVPDWLTVDRADGRAWVSAVALRLVDWTAMGVELDRPAEAVNVRTYVRTPAGERAVYFLSVDATDPLAVETARRIFRLPYHRASIDRERTDGTVRIAARRRRPGSTDAELTVAVEPGGSPSEARPDTLPAFLVERYRYAVEGPLGTRLVGGVGHDPWRLRPASASVEAATVLSAAGIEPSAVDGSIEDPIAHHSPGTEMRVDLPRPTAGGGPPGPC